MNKITLSGRLCNDAELITTPNGKSVAKFNFAVNRRFKQEGKPEADFFQCVAFNKTAEIIAKHTQKGTKLLLWGEMQNNDFTDESGYKHYRNQVVLEGFEFCESKGNKADSESGNSESDLPDMPGFAPINDEGDQLPF